MMAIDDDMLMAFVDGELDEIGRARVERALASDPALKARFDTQQRLRARLAAHYAPAVEEAVPERLRSMLETNVVDLPRRARPPWRSVAALAATLVLGLAIGRTLLVPGAPQSGPIAVEGGAMVALGTLAEALDTQLASAQAADAQTRIGVSFARSDGRLCRTFDSTAAAGVACRTDTGWQVMVTAAGSGGQGGQYRQAGSESLLVQQAAQEMMAGEPLDDAAERRARDSGWRRGGASR